jgi:uncharacterized small protein (DUF1192 family)
MQLIGKSKIGKLSAKGNDYPQLRLPKLYYDAVGKTARIYETEHEGRQAFLIVTEQSVPKEDTVLKPSEEVLKQRPHESVDKRLSALESQIAELKALLLTNENQKAPQSPLFRQSTPKNQWARPDSNRRPPPCEGDVITA